MTRLLLTLVFSLVSLPAPIAPPVVVAKPASQKKLTARQQARLDAAEFLRHGGTVGDWDAEAFALTPFCKLTGKAYQSAWAAYHDEFARYLAKMALAA